MSHPSRGRVVFVGAVHEAEPALRALLESGAEIAAVYTPAAGEAGRLSGYVDLAPLAEGRGIPVRRPADLNAPEEVERIRALAPDLIVVVGWTRLLSADLLAIPPRGCVGFHASLLPRHRGRAPVNWAILRGETVSGNTLMYLHPEADRGDIIDQRAVPISPEDTCGTVYARIAEAGADMLRMHLAGLLEGRAPRRPQDEPASGPMPPLPKRTPEMGITDWDRSPREVHDWIRALTHPYPGAFSRIAGRRIVLWRSAPPMPGGSEGPPGEILGPSGDAVRIAARGGGLDVLRVQEEGGPEQSGASWYARQARGTGRIDPVDPATSRWALGLGPRPVAPRSAVKSRRGAG